jgi:hypothetical protein
MFFTFPEDARWNADRQAVEFGVEIGERKLRRRQLTEDRNVEISGRDCRWCNKRSLDFPRLKAGLDPMRSASAGGRSISRRGIVTGAARHHTPGNRRKRTLAAYSR